MKSISDRSCKNDFELIVGTPDNSFEYLVYSIRKFGIYVYSDPIWKSEVDPTAYAFIVCQKKLNKKELLSVSKDLNKLYKDRAYRRCKKYARLGYYGNCSSKKEKHK